MSKAVFQLFDEFRDRWARGEWPDAAEYLERAGGDADELALLIDAFLQRAEPPPPREEALALVEAWAKGESPLLELRARRGLRRDAVVDFVVETFGLDPAKRAKVRRYYHELETGQLDPAGVSGKLVVALGRLLGARLGDLLAWRPALLTARPAYYRAAAPPAAAPAPQEAAAELPDEIDLLFTGGGQ